MTSDNLPAAGVSRRPCENDSVSNPAHYTAGGIEVIEAIEAWGLGFCDGNAVKYIARAGKKDPAKTVEDLKKARWYIDRMISGSRVECIASPARRNSDWTIWMCLSFGIAIIGGLLIGYMVAGTLR